MDASEVLNFWFTTLKSKDWFAKNPMLDKQIKDRFYDVHSRAQEGELFGWRSSAEGRLAEIIILDQFSRNIFRDSPEAFANDNLALVLSQEMVLGGWDQKIPIERRAFVYLPYMHSESRLIHDQAVQLFNQKGLESNYDYELKHKSIIDRFGRFPHRNQILQRPSTAEEIEFLKGPGSSF
jgi:uncharacterized protein (DUF924 family)